MHSFEFRVVHIFDNTTFSTFSSGNPYLVCNLYLESYRSQAKWRERTHQNRLSWALNELPFKPPVNWEWFIFMSLLRKFHFGKIFFQRQENIL